MHKGRYFYPYLPPKHRPRTPVRTPVLPCTHNPRSEHKPRDKKKIEFSFKNYHFYSFKNHYTLQRHMWSDMVSFQVSFLTLSFSILLRNQYTNQMSRVLRKLAFCIGENRDTDQLRSNREADQRLCFHYTDSKIPLLPRYETASVQPSSVAAQPGLCLTWSETPKTGFLTTRLK